MLSAALCFHEVLLRMSFALNPNIVVTDFKIETLLAETTLIQDVKTDVRISRLSLIAAVLCQIQPNAAFLFL